MCATLRRSMPVVCFALTVGTTFGAQSTYDSQTSTWTISNGWIRTIFQLDASGRFLTREMADLRTGDRWAESPNRLSGPIRLTAGDQVFSSQTQYQFIDQFQQSLQPAGIRQTIVLRDMAGSAQFYVTFEIYDEQPVLHYGVRYRNLTS